ncbi:MAG TPA: hypothetical protein VMX54_11990 [Vicinamibacteria bacterium]|nr:hypothetical protein [Vicinamibacteria bacterium]
MAFMDGLCSTSERVLFQRLLASVAAPRVAAFVDGRDQIALGLLSGRLLP